MTNLKIGDSLYFFKKPSLDISNLISQKISDETPRSWVLHGPNSIKVKKSDLTWAVRGAQKRQRAFVSKDDALAFRAAEIKKLHDEIASGVYLERGIK